MLTEAAIKNARPGDKVRKVFDGNGSGLYLLVQVSGHRSFVVKYTDPTTGKEKTKTLGAWPVLTLAQAREKARELRSGLVQGVAPLTQKAAREASRDDLLRDHGAAWLKAQSPRWSETYRRKQEDLLIRFINPVLGDRPAASITRADVTALLKAVHARLPAGDAARKTRAALSGVLESAGYEDDNPARAYSRSAMMAMFPSKPTTPMAAITDPQEFRSLIKLVWSLQAHPSVVNGMKMLALTALRTIEVRHLCWSDYDAEKMLITIPAVRMKMRRDHLLPVVPAVVALLEQQQLWCPPQQPTDYIFPSPVGKNRPLSENAVLYAIKRAGVVGHTGHGFRSSFSSIAREVLRAEHELVELTLAHVDGSVAGIYNRSLRLDDRRTLLERWAGWVVENNHAIVA